MRFLICILLVCFALPVFAQNKVELGYQTTKRGVVWYRNGLPTYKPQWRLSQDTNAVMWVDTFTSLRYDFDYRFDLWRTKGTSITTLPPKETQTSGFATIDNRTVFWLSPDTILHYYSRTDTAFVPLDGIIHLSAAPANIAAGASNAAAKYTTSLWQDRDDYKLYKWNGTAWVEVGAGGGSDDWGTQIAQRDSSLKGNGLAANPLGIKGYTAAANGEVPSKATGGIAWITPLLVEIDALITNEGIIGVGAGGANDALLTSNTSTANGVTYSGSNTIAVSETPSANGGTILFQADTSLLATVNDVRTDLSYTGASSPVTLNSSTGNDVTVTAGTGIGLTASGTNLTVTNTDPDQLTTNEGGLTVGAGAANTSTIVSNTSGSTPVTVSGSNTVLVTEAGSTITVQADTSLLATVNDLPKEPAHNIVYGTGTGLDSEDWFQVDPTDDNIKIGAITADSGIVNITQPSGFGIGNAAFYAKDVVNLLKYKRGVMPAWYIQQKAVDNGDGSTNNVLEIIYNTFAGGNEETASDANFGISMEPHWIAADGDTVSEWHVFFNDQKGGVHRPITGFFNYHKPEENSWGFAVDKSYFNGNLANKRAKVSINMTNSSLGAYPLEVYKHKNTITTTSASYTRSELDSVTNFVIGNYNTGGESPQLGLSSLMRWNATQDRRAQFYLGLVDMTGSGFDAGTDFVGYYQNSGVFREAFRVRDDFGYFGIKLSGGNQPTQPLHVNGNARVTGAIYDSNNDPGSSGQVLSSTVTGTDWVAAATGTVTGTGASPRVAFWSGTSALTSDADLTYNGTTLSTFSNANSQVNNIVINNSNAGSSAAGNLRFWNNSSTASNRGFVSQIYSSAVASPYGSSQVHWLYENANQIWATNNSAQMLLNTSGLYLGGAVSPSQRLHVNGNAYITGNISIGVSSASQPLHVNGKSYFVDDIGVGITPPTARVHAVGTANNTIIAQSSNTTGTSFQVKNTSASGGDFTFSTTGSTNSYGAGWFLAYDNTALAARYAISPTGNFGITTATTIPRKLFVDGDVRISDVITDTPTKILGVDGDGDVDTVGIGAEAELHITSGTLGTNFHTTISPAQLTASATNNWNPTGLSTAWIIRMSGDGDFSWLTGITAPAFAKRLLLINVGTDAMLLTTENTLSSAANRFAFGRDVVLFPGKSCEIVYDVTSARWRLVSQGGLYDDVQHLYANHVFTSPVSGTTADYDFWEITSPTVSGIAPVSGRWSGVGVNTGSSGTGLGYVASKDHFVEVNAATNTATWAYCKAVIKTPASLSDGSNDYTLRVGLNNSTGGAGASDGAYFNYNHGLSSGAWACHTTNGGNTSATSSGITLAAATTYVLEVVYLPSLVVNFFIDGTLVASNSTFVPSADDMKVLAEIQKSVGTTSREMNVYTLQASVALVK